MKKRGASTGQLSFKLEQSPRSATTAIPQAAIQTLADLLLEALGNGLGANRKEDGNELEDQR